LCDLEIHGRHLCPGCFEKGVTTQKIESVETRRTMYDSLALAYAALSPLLFWPAFVGAPMALYTVVRRWNAPLSVTPRTRIRFYLAAALALAEIAGIGSFIWLLVRLPSLTAVPK
jgi:hypothetical protein